MKKFLILLVVVLSVLTCAMPVFAANLNGHVQDNAGMFTSAEIDKINSYIASNWTNPSFDIYVVTTDDITYDADDFRYEQGVGKNVVILVLIDNNARNYDFYTYGDATRAISDREVDLILDHSSVYDNIKSGRFYDGVLGVIKQTNNYVKSNGDSFGALFVSYLGIGAFVGITVAVIWGICIITSYKKKQRSASYPLERYARLDLKRRDEHFMGSFVTKRVIQSSSGGSRGGGGRSSGGGGGRRGGR